MEKMARLVVIKGSDTGRKIDVGKHGAQLGRSSRNDVPINDEKISRRHCRIYFSPDGILHISDLESANETLLNNAPIHKERLKRGDLITIGDTVLKVMDDASDTGTVNPALEERDSSTIKPAETHAPGLSETRSNSRSRSTRMAFIAFLAGLFIVAYPLAIILGFLSHAHMRKHGGTEKARSMANWAIGMGMLWLIISLLVSSSIM
jgi:hypothetical protein